MSTVVLTGKVRLSYCSLFEAKAPQGGGDPKYSVTLLLPKSDTVTLEKMKDAIAEAREAFCNRHGANALPLKPNHTLKDGDGVRDNGDPFGPECKGHYVITVSSKLKPAVFDAFGNETNDPNEVYSGVYARAKINFYGYNVNGKKGISAGLLGVKKLHDGQPFGLSCSADDFNDGYTDGDDDDIM